MKNKEFVGIDVSKNALDVFILSCKFHFTVSNSPEGFAQLLEIVASKHIRIPYQSLLCFENTGRYSRLLSVFLEDDGFNFAALDAWILNGLWDFHGVNQIKKMPGLLRFMPGEDGMNLTSTKLAGPVLDQIRQLLTLRDKLISHRTAFKNTSRDLHDGYLDGEFDFIKERQESMFHIFNMKLTSWTKK